MKITKEMAIGQVIAAKNLLMLRGDNYNFNAILEYRQSKLADAAYMLIDMLLKELASEGTVDDVALGILVDKIAELNVSMTKV